MAPLLQSQGVDVGKIISIYGPWSYVMAVVSFVLMLSLVLLCGCGGKKKEEEPKQGQPPVPAPVTPAAPETPATPAAPAAPSTPAAPAAPATPAEHTVGTKSGPAIPTAVTPSPGRKKEPALDKKEEESSSIILPNEQMSCAIPTPKTPADLDDMEAGLSTHFSIKGNADQSVASAASKKKRGAASAPASPTSATPTKKMT